MTIGTQYNKTRTAHYLLNDYVRKGNPKSRNRVYVVHRLDQDTSGVVLFAKTEAAKEILQRQWPSTEKRYVAVVHGQLATRHATISSYLTENSAQRVYSTTDPRAGKLAQTAYTVLKQNRKFSLVDIQLLSGRKHQIRVHFAEHGHPITGDKKYGNGEVVSRRLTLHARAITFLHPFSRKPLTFTSAIPPEFLALLAQS